MPKTFHDDPLPPTTIANIEDKGFPITPLGRRFDKGLNEDIELTPRDDYGRHTLYGLNVFLNEMAQQFPVILGLRQIDPLNTKAEAALTTAREAVLDQARRKTASVAVNDATLVLGNLTANVTVSTFNENNPLWSVGHKFPSGVGFRRAFIEFLVLDDNDDPIWASGRTNSLGVIVSGLTDEPLASEFFCDASSPSPPCPPAGTSPGCPDMVGGQCYQPHYGRSGFPTVSSEDQVQIYEELVQNDLRKFTTSFLHRWYDVKDNRILPKGWESAIPSKASQNTMPHGTNPDPDYIDPDNPPGTPGADTVSYQITLTPAQAASVASVRATLYYQATPPYYLNQRFNDGGPGSERSTDTERLYYIASKLNTDVQAADQSQFISDWKLKIAEGAAAVSRPVGAPTMTEWGMAALLLVLVAGVTFKIRRLVVRA